MLDSEKKVKSVYFIGIEGAGTSALAQIYHSFGWEVSGSDNGDHFYGKELKEKGIKVFEKFEASNVPDEIDFVVHSTSFNDNNPEISEAKKRDLKLLSYPEALGELFSQKQGIAVCGSHGKTTTTAMLANTLNELGFDPMSLVGSNVVNWNGNVLLGEGEFFIAETDEYQNKLKYYHPWSVILTNISWDHPDFFPTVDDYERVFADFIKKIPQTGFLFAWGDSRKVLDVLGFANCEIFKYGFFRDNDYVAEKKGKGRFNVSFRGKDLGDFSINLLGDHNILNATAVIAFCHKLNIDMEKVKYALSKFLGTKRRFENHGEFKGAILIDDYAHHPEEITATLKAARENFPNKNIKVVFHPHTFTRTQAMLSEFSQSFDDANSVIVIDIYGSAREKQGGVSSNDLVEMMNRYNSGKAQYIPTIEEASEFLSNNTAKEDVIITMGAGDVWRVIEILKNKK